MTPRRPRCLNSLVGDTLREMKHSLAVHEHRRAPLFDVELARVDLAEVSDQVGLDHVATSDQPPNVLEQLGVGKPAQANGEGELNQPTANRN